MKKEKEGLDDQNKCFQWYIWWKWRSEVKGERGSNLEAFVEKWHNMLKYGFEKEFKIKSKNIINVNN